MLNSFEDFLALSVFFVFYDAESGCLYVSVYLDLCVAYLCEVW